MLGNLLKTKYKWAVQCTQKSEANKNVLIYCEYPIISPDFNTLDELNTKGTIKEGDEVIFKHAENQENAPTGVILIEGIFNVS
jgi:hypothetical protein